MKRPVMILLLFMTVFALPAAAQEDTPACTPDSGTVIARAINSTVLNTSKNYTLYLPPDWCHLTDLPLLVMLHGWGGDNTDWTYLGNLHKTSTTLILAGEINPVVILMPDGDNGLYVPSELGDYESYLINEVIPAIDAEFPTAATGDSRSIGGNSTGAFGALYLGLRHPDQFSAIGLHGSILLTLEQEGMADYVYGPDEELYDQRYGPHIIAREGWPENMRLFIDEGVGDEWNEGVAELVPVLLEQEVEFELHNWSGSHHWSYWSKHAADYLRFYVGVNQNE